MSDVNAAYALPFEAQFHADRAQQEYIFRILRTVHTAKLVSVLAVHPYADGSGGTVDVQPLVLGTDTNGQPLTEGPIYGMPWIRLQGGNSAFIVDPVAGDKGLAVFADRDITATVAQKSAAPAATARICSEMDGLYVGGVLNAVPTQWVKLSSAGIDIKSPTAITLEAPTITTTSTGNTTINAATLVINANTQFNGNVSGTSTGTGSVEFAAPVTAPDFIAPNAKLNTHLHNVSGSSTVGNPHN